MSTNIVIVNVTEQVAPAPSTLQSTGALISTGGTTTAAGTSSLLTQLSDLTALLSGTAAITSLAWTSSVVTVTTAAPHGVVTGVLFPVVIMGAVPSAYNGSYTATASGASTFTYPLTANPGAETTPGTWISPDESELLAMATTFFAQGSTVPVYVLELGEVNAAEGITALQAWITANPSVYYRYLLPAEWDNATGLTAFLLNYTSPTAMVYFHITTTLATYSNYAATLKDVNLSIQAPAAPSSEFSAAADFWVMLSRSPSSINKVPPTSFGYVYGVTAYPGKGNQALLTTLKAANVNVIGTGAEANISNTLLAYGKTLDGHDESWWYAVDHFVINTHIQLAAAVINGSNTPQNPLYYNQPGINKLEGVVEMQAAADISFGLLLSPVAVTSVPFNTYTTANPSDYNAGIYNGLAATATPQTGFQKITFNFNVSGFVPASS